MDYQVISKIAKHKEMSMVLATIVRATGSTPRHEGTNMLVMADGQFLGTVGGGTGEERIRLAALEAIGARENRYVVITLNDDMAMKEGMICGGTMEVYLEFLAEADKAYYQELVQMIERKKLGVLVRHLESQKKWIMDAKGKILVGDQGEIGLLSPGELDRLIHREHFRLEDGFVYEAIVPYERLVIFGAGHISVPISEMATRCEFDVTVVDDRDEFANQGRFPWASQVMAKPFEEALLDVAVDDSTYVVLVTRGHSFDTVCLREVLKGSWKYIGMIGSKTRVKKLLDNLENEGYDRTLLNRIHTPIGLDIGAETPDEIAISVMAEIISVKRGKDQLKL